MKMQSMQSDVVLGNTGRSTAFNMDANAKAFRVLSDTLYQNKIGSLVREVSCNAYDSHVMAGHPEMPFTIHMPDMMEPHFSVRDYGIGLDDEGVRDVFCTYFRSTKDTDNRVVGSFGLGSKTPFAYTDAFTIVAIKDNMKRQYSAYIDGEGLPAITLMDEQVTEEGNGVEIIVPVTNSSDFNSFRREVANQLVFFDVKPTIENSEYDIQYMDWQSAGNYMECENVFIGNSNSSFTGVWIVQGVVGYRMDVKAVSAAFLSDANREFLDIISNAALLRFDLGMIEVTPSREGVSYSKYTLANIESLIEKARNSVKGIVQAQLDATGGNWNLAMELNTNPILRRLAKVTAANLDMEYYFNVGGQYFLDLAKVANLDGVALPNQGNDADDDYAVVPADFELDAVVRSFNLCFRSYERVRVRRGTSKWREHTNGASSVKVSTNLVILVKDTLDKPKVREREFMYNYMSSTDMFMLYNRDGTVVTPEQLAEVQKRIGTATPFKMMSNVPLPVVDRDSRSGGPYVKQPIAYAYGENDDFYNTRYWEREYGKLSDFENGAYYTIVNRLQVDMANICRVVTAMAGAGVLDKPLLAIRAKDAVKIENNPLWVKAYDKAKEIVDGIAVNKTLTNGHMLSKAKRVRIDKYDDGLLSKLKDACKDGTIPANNPIHRLFRAERVIEKAKARAAARGYNSFIATAFDNTGVSVSAVSIDKAVASAVVKATDIVDEKFPLLPFISSHGSNEWRDPADIAEHVIHYINTVSGV
jgi:hypothetical protein